MRGSSVGGMLAIIALTNVVLLYGLYALDWTPATNAFLFWFEAAVIGAMTLIKVAASLPGEIPGTGKSVSYRRLPRPGGSARVSSSVPRAGGRVAARRRWKLTGRSAVLESLPTH